MYIYIHNLHNFTTTNTFTYVLHSLAVVSRSRSYSQSHSQRQSRVIVTVGDYRLYRLYDSYIMTMTL